MECGHLGPAESPAFDGVETGAAGAEAAANGGVCLYSVEDVVSAVDSADRIDAPVRPGVTCQEVARPSRHALCGRPSVGADVVRLNPVELTGPAGAVGAADRVDPPVRPGRRCEEASATSGHRSQRGP